MGTDVISSRVDHSHWVTTWKNNIQQLCQFQIPFSLTLYKILKIADSELLPYIEKISHRLGPWLHPRPLAQGEGTRLPARP